MTRGWRILITVSVVLAVLAIPVIVVFGGGWWKMITADWRGDVGVNEQVSADAVYRIEQYEWFYDQCAAIQSTEADLIASTAELELHTEGSYRYNQLLANITAITSARAELINAYNAEADKADTAANFLASDLPYNIDIEQETTQCSAS